MKKTKLLFTSLLLVFGISITSCGPTTSEPTTLPPEPFTSEVESNLVEGTDYNEHSQSYSKNKYDYDKKMWYINDLSQVPLPDPQIYFEDGTYYIVGTNDGDAGKTIACYTTTDFQTYTPHWKIYDPASIPGTWESETPQIYAPEMYCFDGVYYLYYSAIAKDNVRYNSVVKASSPLGPYEPIIEEGVNGLANPVFDGDPYHVLDATIFVDDDGQMYMYYAISGDKYQFIAGVKMNSPYEADWSTRVDLVKPGELSSKNSTKPMLWEMLRGFHIAEAPFMIKSNGKYYLTYSVNGCWNKHYNVCYAVADSPLGDFVKPYAKNQTWTNLLLGYPGTNIETNKVYRQWSGFASGTGHHCFFKIGDQIMIGYHAHRNRDWNSETAYTPRFFAIDYIHFNEEGVPFCNGPTYSLQPLPKAISGYENIAPKAAIRSENVTNDSFAINEYNVDCYNLIQEEGKETILGTGLSYIELTFDKEYEIGGFAVYNTAYYEQAVYEIKYADFGNGNAVKDMVFLEDALINHATEFIFPNSAFTVQFNNTFRSNKLTLCFDLYDGGQINEIVVLAK